MPIRRDNGHWVVDTVKMFENIINMDYSPRDLAITVQYKLGFSLGVIASKYLSSADIPCVFVSGGASVNDYIIKGIRDAVGVKVCANRIVPRGDGGVALGQIYLALSREEL